MIEHGPSALITTDAALFTRRLVARKLRWPGIAAINARREPFSALFVGRARKEQQSGPLLTVREWPADWSPGQGMAAKYNVPLLPRRRTLSGLAARVLLKTDVGFV